MDTDESRRRTRRSVLERLGTGAALVATSPLAGCSLLTGEEDEPTPSSTETPTATVDPDGPGVGVYLGDDTKLREWEAWFGRRVDYYSFALFSGSWADYRRANWPLEVDLTSLRSDRRVAVSFTMFPDEATLEQVAAGEFDDRYRTLAQDLTDSNLADAHLRFGWEFNGRWADATAVGRPDAYVTAWRRVVESMREADGADFSFVWSPNIWRYHMPPPEAYPGDDWVDEVGLTVYDTGDHYPYPSQCDSGCVRQHRQKAWNDIVSGRGSHFGLDFWADFAREHGKPLVFPEYGITAKNGTNPGGGDNPLFFRKFHDWVRHNRDVVGWHNLWSWTNGPHFVGPARLKESNEYAAFPSASKTFKRLFGP